MQDSNPYQALLRSKIKAAIDKARAASVFSHQGVKGSVLEILIGELFEPLLPADIGVGTGQIIDCYKSPMSSQVDIILFDKSILPPVLIDGRLGLFPVESVLYTIEVKTTLNATELRAAHQSAEKIYKFGYLPGLKDELGKEKNHPIEKIRSVVFALGSDLTGKGMSEAERYRKIYANDSAHLRAICVAGKGYWYDNGDHWVSAAFTDEFDEILSFIGGVTNTYKKVSRSRHSPLLGKYIIPDVTGLATVESRKIVRVPIRCEGCNKEAMFKPNVGKMNLVVKGAIINSEPCSDCGGKMSSIEGEYTFVNGQLIEKNG